MRIKPLYFLSVLLIILLPFNLFSQRDKGIRNLPAYDLKPIHFGFILGGNEMNFSVKLIPDYYKIDSLLVLHSGSRPGFHVGIVSDLRLAEYFNLRFVPTLSFGDRLIEYTIIEKGKTENYKKKVESSFVELPLTLKYKSVRMTNTRAYVLGGIKYNIDMASLAKKKLKEDDIIRLKRDDFLFEIGTGFDFYLVYFKFGVEVKMAYGIFDILEREKGLVYTNAIEKLKSKIFYLTLTFE